ncbi:MAG TPA: hypothetical protein VFL42_06750, partial [Terriglobales bacterium]|nr:hypothetical protein [Terriglobales bacterium]
MATYSVPKLDDYSTETLAKATEELLSAVESEGSSVDSEAAYKDFYDRWLARKNGILTQINDSWLKLAPPEFKRAVGIEVNKINYQVREEVTKNTRGRLSVF